MDEIHSCAKCESILVDSEPTGSYQRSYELLFSDFADYARGSNSCQLFSMLFSACVWPEGYLDSLKPTSRIALQYDSQIDSSFKFSIAKLPRKPKDLKSYGELLAFGCELVTDPDDVATLDVPGRLLSPALESSTTALLRGWYSSCRDCHPDCQPPLSAPLKGPLRLIHIGNSEGDPLKLMLFEKSPQTGTIEYVALSYIWGGPQSFQTCKDNVNFRLNAIQLESLPQTLTDAVLDDPHDKATQITMMGDIYRNAAVTLVAATSLSSNAGFLSSTFDQVIAPLVRCRFNTSDGREGGVYLIQKRQYQDRFPIESRGWTMQERLLSTRLLFFHDGRIDWVRRTGHLFAGCSSSYSVNLINETVAKRVIGKVSFPPETPDDAPYDVPYEKPLLERWAWLYWTFSQRQLTDPTDRLPAFSGIAKEFRRCFPEVGEYVAGLWTTHLPQQLLWRSEEKVKQFVFKHPSSAPSWSRASTDGVVSLPNFAYAPADIKLSVLDAHIQPVDGSDRYGLLADAYLKVSGRLKTAYWNITEQSIEMTDELSALGNTRTSADSFEHTPEGPLAGKSLQVHCLETQDAKYWARRFKTERGPPYTGLLLLPCRRRPAAFRRVGLFCLAKVDKDESSYEVIAAAVKNLAWFERTDFQPVVLV